MTATNITANLADHFSVRLKDDKPKNHGGPPLCAACLSIPFRTVNDSMFAVYAAIISQWIEYDNDLVFTVFVYDSYGKFQNSLFKNNSGASRRRHRMPLRYKWKGSVKLLYVNYIIYELLHLELAFIYSIYELQNLFNRKYQSDHCSIFDCWQPLSAGIYTQLRSKSISLGLKCPYTTIHESCGGSRSTMMYECLCRDNIPNERVKNHRHYVISPPCVYIHLRSYAKAYETAFLLDSLRSMNASTYSLTSKTLGLSEISLLSM